MPLFLSLPLVLTIESTRYTIAETINCALAVDPLSCRERERAHVVYNAHSNRQCELKTKKKFANEWDVKCSDVYSYLELDILSSRTSFFRPISLAMQLTVFRATLRKTTKNALLFALILCLTGTVLWIDISYVSKGR